MSKPELAVSVATRYLPEESDPERERYAFAYTITIRNSGDVPAQLIARHWLITDAAGSVQDVRGLGVVGHQPLLQPGERFEYTSWAVLPTPRGRMEGSYFCMTEKAESFEVEIPGFELSLRSALH